MNSKFDDEYLFAYGVLRSEAGQKIVFGRVLDGTDAVLPGYTVDYIKPVLSDTKTLATMLASNPIIRHTGNTLDRVVGTKFKVSHSQLECVDDYEQTHFRRIKVALSDGTYAWMFIRA